MNGETSNAPPGIQRYSSRLIRLDRSFLTPRLTGALAYDRIAGYFCGSILESAGEALESVTGSIRVVCNSSLRLSDVAQARAAAQALRREWCASFPEERLLRMADPARQRLGRLFEFLASKKLQVRVLPDEVFGLIHGKAGVITRPDGTRTAFLGSVNESPSAWRLNYELLWEDPSPEAVAWVQAEFDALWTHHAAIPLESVEFILADIARLARRTELSSVEEWGAPQAGEVSIPVAPVFVETPVYRKEIGLWEHQKFFVKLAFEAHQSSPGGARFVLADQVGLGKTLQLAMAAELMALVGDGPVLVLAPKTLLWQWQDEMRDLLDLPSAVWDGRRWVDESGIEHPEHGVEGIRRCPRRVGVVSTGLITSGSAAAEELLGLRYECVILDEAHRARRKNLGPDRENEAPDANNLLRFLYLMSPRAKSLLLATATPVQLHAIEAWDLLDALARGSEAVLGNPWSRWRKEPGAAVDLVTARVPLPADDLVRWDWLRSPLPPKHEGKDFEILRNALDLADAKPSAEGGQWADLSPGNRKRVRDVFPALVTDFNPFIRHIVRRSRDYLEKQIDPATSEPYLQPIEVKLFGEDDSDALLLPVYLKEAYGLAEDFCRLLSQRLKGSGFLKTLLLRRMGSSIEAGMATAQKLLGTWEPIEDPEEDSDEFEDSPQDAVQARALTTSERGLLEQFIGALQANQERDPKYARILKILRTDGWLAARGCIVFSQFYDSVRWLAEQLVRDFPDERIGLYAGSGRSALWEGGQGRPASREELKQGVRAGSIRLLLGTDAASEGLNLQRLGSLINLDLPWNPTRLEQRKGRIQRIGQVHPDVWVYNMRYRGSVEDRVHQLLSARLQEIHALFGQLPDVLEDVWIDVALGQQEEAKKRINAAPLQHPFDIRYRKVERVDWESCAEVLSADAKRSRLRNPWKA